jgi:hypothetical protein
MIANVPAGATSDRDGKVCVEEFARTSNAAIVFLASIS